VSVAHVLGASAATTALARPQNSNLDWKPFMSLLRIAAAAAALIAASAGALAQTAPPASPPATISTSSAVPAPDTVLMLIRAHVLAVGQANAANDYEVLRQLGSARFRALNTPESLSKTFASLRGLGLDLSAVAVTTPVLTEPPTITDAKLLRLYGAFPTRPVEIAFGMLFEPEAGAWKLNAISVGARPAAEVAQLTMPMTAADGAKSPAAAGAKAEKPSKSSK